MKKKQMLQFLFGMCCISLFAVSPLIAQKEAEKVGKEITKRVRGGIVGKDRLDGVLAGRVKVIDLTYPLNAETPHWPAPGYDPFHREIFATLEKDHVLSGKYCTPEHLGTHVDAPNHFERGLNSVDRIPLDDLFGYAVVLNVRGKAAANPDYRVTPEDLRDWERKHRDIPEGAIVLAYTGWGERVKDSKQYQNRDAQGVMHFPGWSVEAVDFLLRARKINAIGIDTPSIDYGPSTDFAVHHKWLGAEKYAIENLASLEQLPPRGAFLIVTPIKIEGGSGGQARVLALIE